MANLAKAVVAGLIDNHGVRVTKTRKFQPVVKSVSKYVSREMYKPQIGNVPSLRDQLNKAFEAVQLGRKVLEVKKKGFVKPDPKQDLKAKVGLRNVDMSGLEEQLFLSVASEVE